MDIIIKKNQVRESLELIDPHSGTDYIQDFIGNTGALTDGSFTWDEDLDAYWCDVEVFEWWSKVIRDQQHLEYRKAQLIEEHGFEKVHQAMANAGSCDLEDEAALMNQVLDEVFP